VIPGVQNSFICVPIKTEGRTVGPLSVDKRFHDEESLRSDLRLLEIVASFIAQALKINEIVPRSAKSGRKKSAPSPRTCAPNINSTISSAPPRPCGRI